MTGERKGPTRAQAWEWSRLLKDILNGPPSWLRNGWDESHRRSATPEPVLADQIGRYFPKFAAALEAYKADPPDDENEETGGLGASGTGKALVQAAWDVLRQLPEPYERHGLAEGYDKLEDALQVVIRECVREFNKQDNLVLDLGNKLGEWAETTGYLTSTSVRDELDRLRAENERLRELLARSVHVDEATFDDGEHGCRFLVGEDHVVVEWRGDGIATDTIFVEEPKLVYMQTTTPHIRCMRMVLEQAHWEVLAAMADGPGDGELKSMHERGYGVVDDED